MDKPNRRSFLQTAALGVAVSSGRLHAQEGRTWRSGAARNRLPRWRGFNLLDYFTPNPPRNPGSLTTDEDLRWMADWGFDFVRLPMA